MPCKADRARHGRGNTVSDILIIDCDREYRDMVCTGLRKLSFSTAGVGCFQEALGWLVRSNFQVVILDEDSAPDGIGPALHHIRAADSSPEVIVLSWLGDPDAAEAAIRAGAWNYFSKPISLLRLKVVLERIFTTKNRQNNGHAVALKREGIVGNSRPLQSCLDEVARAAATETNVLITGETGTGKELFARAIHENSMRSNGDFVTVDCAALPESLAESMLFGHEKGAFTSADAKAGGLVQEADKGTLFLDEVGELPLSVQKVFLRVLEHRRFRPVGSTREEQSDFRLVAATNRDLNRMVEVRSFRRDLLYRLQAMSIELPPLRSISEDINEITCFYIGKITTHMHVPRKGFSPDFLDALMNYEWPGNVRELVNALQRAISMAGDEAILFPRHLPTSIRAHMARTSAVRTTGARCHTGPDQRRTPAQNPSPHATPPEHAPERPPRLKADTKPKEIPEPAPKTMPPLKAFRIEHLSRLERTYLQDLLAATGHDVNACLTISGLSRARFYALLSEHGLKRK